MKKTVLNSTIAEDEAVQAIETIMHFPDINRLLLKMDDSKFENLYSLVDKAMWERLFPSETINAEFEILEQELKRISKE